MQWGFFLPCLRKLNPLQALPVPIDDVAGVGSCHPTAVSELGAVCMLCYRAGQDLSGSSGGLCSVL